MKNKLRLLAIITSISSGILYADTCPTVESFNPLNPPSGWSLLLAPVIDGEKYHFSSAIHSLNGAYYYGQVVCKYASCPNSFCPAFALISDKTYDTPNTKAFPWNQRSVLAFTFTCTPPNNDPSVCSFK